ncbi:UbiD family decarboxylase [Legionella maceachernii]|uniref:3-polyprenyl-4-hydroxybenzoate decarboxylase n=2 Tax=Legionella TaxID=445 RepID=A0A0W0W6R0_9GAMM|nr:UbiD family decarboxylase [Legionella maceachernii]KTD28059.1 3-polyprenyl-4-hydroxybenzoate decarboxylase [Legionella maceachernii]SKA07747.1 2,5-furandicarboxylate decarboxylase 1 [Legionella maceachernii]SUO99788.1 Phenolic acid decarboxylase subunit C [Legionella maceachernii]
MKDLRDWLHYLDDNDLLSIIRDDVDLKHDLMHIANKFEGKKACFFPKLCGHTVPVVTGILQQRSWIAAALGIHPGKLLSRFQHAVSHPIAWKEVPQDKAPVHEVVIKKDIDIKKILPIVTHHEKDAAAFITSGCVNAKNLVTKKQNFDIHRMQVQAPDKLSILILPQDLFAYFSYAEEQNIPLPVTITIGHDPIVQLASQAMAPLDLCELEIAGALRGKPLPVVKSYTNDIMIPATAEFSIEGHILPNVRCLEGPFGEFPKYYTGYSMLPIVQIDCITHRKSPIYQTNNPAGAENIVLGGVPREASILERMRYNFPNVTDLRLTPGGQGRYHLVIKMKKDQYGQAKNVIACAFGMHYDIKLVIVVDEDIDIDSPDQIEWAVATRFQADRDLVVINRALGSKLDPSAEIRGLSSKMGLDATAYLGDKDRFFVSKTLGENIIDIRKVLHPDSHLFKETYKKT